MKNKPFGNIDRLNKLVAESDFDAIIAISPENVPYTSGVLIWSQRGIRDRLAITLWPKSSDPSLLVCTIEEPQAVEESFIEDIRGYVEFKTSPIELLADALHEKGLSKGRLGIEMKYLSAHYWEELQTLLPEATFAACDELFENARMIKTPQEIELMGRAARSTERALLATFATTRVGETEKSMSERLTSNILGSGADKICFQYINVGPNTGYPHCDPTDYIGQQGDIIKADCGGFYDGYVSDVARTAVLGKASDEQKTIYKKINEIHLACVDTARPGNKASDIFHMMEKEHKRVDLPFPLPHSGHSVGLTVHEAPVLSPMDHTELEPNMVLYIETRVRWPDKAGYHIEDLVQITDGAPNVITGGFFDPSELLEI